MPDIKYDLIDRILLLLCCTTLYLLNTDTGYAIIPIIITVLLSCLFAYYENDRLGLAGNLLFALLCIYIPEYFIFLPLLMYNIFCTRLWYGVFAALFAAAWHFSDYSVLVLSFTAVFLLAAYLLRIKTVRLKNLNYDYNELRDNSTRISRLLEEKNLSLLKNQDNEINIATLDERNRISREIHDNIGHLLSRSLLQVGAMLTLTRDETLKEGLTDLRDSLSDGMDQIRSSIHQMYDESIDLYAQIENIVKDFTFCKISFDYDITNSPPAPLKHSMIAIVKEALTNIIRHSNATKAAIRLKEHPAMYQLIIKDNGILKGQKQKDLIRILEKQEYGEGMGLRNISDRIKGFNGNLNLSYDHGFVMFISVPKKIN